MASKLSTYVALLRGINVGGNNTISMAELKQCFEAAGMQHVTTYINSGNVIFRSSQKAPRKLEDLLEKTIQARFAKPIPVVLRSQDEMTALMRRIPKHWEHSVHMRLYVAFLRHAVDKPDN